MLIKEIAALNYYNDARDYVIGLTCITCKRDTGPYKYDILSNHSDHIVEVPFAIPDRIITVTHCLWCLIR